MVGEAAAFELFGRAWGEVERAADEYRAAAAERVREWVWCGPDPHRWEFREAVVGNEEPLRVVEGDPGPERRSRFARFGYDADGLIVVAQRFTDHSGGRSMAPLRGVLLRETLWCGDAALHLQHEHGSGGLHRVVLSTLSRQSTDATGQTIALEGFGRESSSRTRWLRRDGQVVESYSESFAGVLDDPEALTQRRREVYERDDAGLMRVRWELEFSRWSPEAQGDGGVAWLRRSPKALRAARKLVDAELPERIRAWVARVAPAEPVYALGLLWSIDAPTLPPALGLGTVRELRAWRQRYQPGFELRSMVWNPAEWECFDSAPVEFAGDEALEDAFALLNQDWERSMTDREPAMTLRRSVSALSAGTLGLSVDAAIPFAVFVIADELDDSLPRQLRKTLPAATERAIERGA
jgi:hypothetical protein